MTAQAMRQGVSLLARIPGVAIVLALLIVGFTLANPNFATPGNIANLLVQSTLLTLLVLPALPPEPMPEPEVDRNPRYSAKTASAMPATRSKRRTSFR